MADPTPDERAKSIRQCLSHWDSARVGDLVEGAAFSHITSAVEAETARCLAIADKHGDTATAAEIRGVAGG